MPPVSLFIPQILSQSIPDLMQHSSRGISPEDVFESQLLVESMIEEEGQPLSILVITWNLMGTLPSEQNIRKLLEEEKEKHDVVVIGTQECQRSLFTSFFCEGKQKWVHLLCSILEGPFVMVGEATQQGLHVAAFLRVEICPHLSSVFISKIKTGLCGCIGNKGAVQIGFSIGSKRLLFVNNHLAAHQDKSTKRNQDLASIVTQMVESSLYDEVFLFGDLNYRIEMGLEEFRQYQLSKLPLSNLVKKDQLHSSDKLAWFKKLFSEGSIHFSPTYKLQQQNNQYNLKRVPGWTDRIFYRTSRQELALKAYGSKFDIMGSDHRPVYASFLSRFKSKKEGYVKLKTHTSFCC